MLRPLLVRLLPLLIVCGLVVGCARGVTPGLPPSINQFGTPEPYANIVSRMDREGERNWVLHLYTLAIAALREGDHETAKRALDEAILQIEVIYGDSPEARAARSLWQEEGSKVFKGDPHERALIYFYRSVLYMQESDWQNARALLRSAILTDALAEEEQFRADWVLFEYLLGICNRMIGSEALEEEAFRFASQNYESFRANYGGLQVVSPRGINPAPVRFTDALPPFPNGANVVALAQLGTGPQKVGEGQFSQFLGYRPAGGSDSRATLHLNGTPIGPVQIVDSVFYQAATRGGREMDQILGRQAKTRRAAQDAGTIAAYGGGWVALSGLEAESGNAAAIGLGIAAVGLAVYGISTLIKPQADTRQLRYTPELFGVFPMRLAPGEHQLKLVHQDYTGNFVIAETQASVTVPENNRDVQVVLFFQPPGAFAVTPSGPPPMVAGPGN